MYVSGWILVGAVLVVGYLINALRLAYKRETVLLRAYSVLSDWAIGGFKQIREGYAESDDPFVDPGETIERAVEQWDEITKKQLREMAQVGIRRASEDDVTEIVSTRVYNKWWWDSDDQR